MRRLAWRITAVIMLVSIIVAPLLYAYSTSVSSGYYIEPIKWSYTVNVTYSNYTSDTNTTYTYNYGVYPNVTSITNGTTSSQMMSNDIWNRSLYMLPSNQQTISNNVWNRYVQLLPSNQQTVSNNIWNRSVLAKPNTGAYCTPAILNYTIYNNLDHNINGFALYLNSTTFPYWENLTGLFPFETRYLVVTDVYGEHLHYWIPYLDEYNKYGFIVVKMGIPAHSYATILLHFCDNTYDSRYDTPEGVALYGYNFTSGDKLDNYWNENGSGSYDIVGGLLRMSASDGGGWYGLTMSKAFTGEGYVLALVTDGLYMDGNRGGNNTLFTGFIQDSYFPSGTGGASNTILGTVSRIGLGEGDKDWGLQLETADGSNSNVLDSDNTQQNNLYFDKLLVWSIYYNSSMTIGQVTGETTDSNTNPFVNRTFSTLPTGSLQPLIAVEDSSSDGATLGLEMNGLYIVAYPILDNITVTENAVQESRTPAYPCYTSILKTTSVSITSSTTIASHTKKWVFNDNQSYIKYSNGLYVPAMEFKYIPVNISNANANDTIQLDLSSVMPSGYGITNITDDNGNSLGFWVESAFDKVWVKLAESGNYTIKVNIDKTTNNMGDPNQAFMFYDDMESWSGWVQEGSGTVSQSSDYAHSGTYSLKKDSNGDPNGGYKEIGTTLGRDIVVSAWIYSETDRSSANYDRFGITDDNGNGYGFTYIHGDHEVSIDVRSNYDPTSEATISAPEIHGEWYHAYLYILSNGTIKAVYYYNDGSLAGETSYTDTQYSSFTRVYVLGGYPYYVDDMAVYNYNPNITTNIGGAVAGVSSNVTYPYELAYYEETSNGTVSFLSDPSWVNSEGLYVDIVHSYIGTPYGNVTVEDDSPSLWVVNGLYNDSLVHVLYMDRYYHNHYLLLINASNDNILYAYKITSDNIVIDPPSGSYVLAVGDPEPCTSSTSTGGGGGGGSISPISIPGLPSITPPSGLHVGSPTLGTAGGVISLLLFLAFYVFYNQRMTHAQALAVGAAISGIASILIWGPNYLGPILIVFAIGVSLYYVLNK